MERTHKELPNIDVLLATLSTEVEKVLRPAANEWFIVGIHTGGLWVAEQLHQHLNNPHPLYALDICFYRDDYHNRGLTPKAQGSQLPHNLEGTHILLVDDVIMSGRTLRAAINELFDYGRPATVRLATLIDLGQRALPIQPDAVGTRLLMEAGHRIKLRGPAPLALEWVNSETIPAG